MGQRIRSASIRVGSAKIANASDGEYDTASGDEAQIADGGYVGHSDGATMTKLNFNTIEYITGEGSQPLRDAMLKKKDVTVVVTLITGRVEQIGMRIVNNGQSWEHAKGTHKGKFAMEGGEPKVLG